MTTTEWTDARVTQLVKLWALGLPSSDIAESLGGTTRNAIIGKAYRLKLAPRRPDGPAPGRPSQAPPKPRVRVAYVHYPAAVFTPDRAAPSKPTSGPRRDLPEPTSLDLSLLDLTDATCKWPRGTSSPYRFCGHATWTGSPYCAHHAARGTDYRPSEANVRRLENLARAV